MPSLTSGVQMREKIFERRIKAQITIELPVVWMSRIADHGTPHLLARLKIAREDGDTVRTAHGRIDAVARTRLAVENRVRVGDEVFDTVVCEKLLDAGLVSAFRQPDAARATAKM